MEIKRASGAATSRAWGHGAVVWSPGHVSARVYVPTYSQGPAQRTVQVSTSTVDADGRLKSHTINLSATESSTGLELKQMLATSLSGLGALASTDRMRITVYGAELTDESTLSSLAPTATEVHARLQIRRRGLPPPSPTASPDADDRPDPRV